MLRMSPVHRVAIAALVAVVAFFGAFAGDARAASVLTADLESPGEVYFTYLYGSYDMKFSGVVGSDVATLNGTFNVTGGAAAPYFGGVGAQLTMSSTLTNFESSVTGNTGITTQPAFGGDIFAEAATYAPTSGLYDHGPEYISFDFDHIMITAGPQATLYAGMASNPAPKGFIYNYNGLTYVNFWMNAMTYDIPECGHPFSVSTGDWLTVVVNSSVGEPVPEPGTIAMGAIAAVGVGTWLRRRRRAASA